MKKQLYQDQVNASKDYINQFGLIRVAIFNAVEASLRHLQTDYIDLFQIHCFDPTCADRSDRVRAARPISLW